ncbi:MAG: type restriction enzyme protein [Acidimicrobiaceae bacterium]
MPDSAQYYRGRPRRLDGDQPTPWKPETRFFTVESWGKDVDELDAPGDEVDAALTDDADIELRVGYVEDFISGLPVRATPEEVDAVQVMARRLVEDFGYEVAQIQTRPQFRVRQRPSDSKRSFPVDIAVFRSTDLVEDDLFLVVECKKKNRRDGLAQLKLYLDMSPAEIGVWFNGEDHHYIRKLIHRDGSRTYEPLPTIPRRGQRIEDVGLHRRVDLKKPSNLKAVFRDLRNHLAGNVTGITRDEALASEIVNLLFCKIFDEVNTGFDEIVSFRSGFDEDPKSVHARVVALFERVKAEYTDVFTKDDKINLDPLNLVYVVGELQPYCVTEADRDAVGDAFEVFIGPALRGTEGQFFTPRNVVRLLVEMLDPRPGERIIDPACGSGGFLIMALEHVWQHLEEEGRKKGWSEVQLDRRKRDVANKAFRGFDKDSFLAKVTKAYMAIMGDGRGGVFCENTLYRPEDWSRHAQDAVELGAFDVVLTNPPFGSKIRIKGAQVLGQYDLAHKWKRVKGGEPELTSTLQADSPPQLLFLERCLQLLKPGGRLGIVLPESILGNPSYAHVLSWLADHATIEAVVTMPEALFKTSGKGGTHTKVAAVVLRKYVSDDTTEIFMADAKWCGHDSRGNPTIRQQPDGSMVVLDDVPTIAGRYSDYRRGETGEGDHLGFTLKASELRSRILVPKYYDPEISRALDEIRDTHELRVIGDLVESEVIALSTGIEVGKMAYGTGPIPFIRTSDLSNWELKADPKHGVSEELFAELGPKLDVQAGDILVVRDGTYLIGTCAMVMPADTRILYQSHLYKIRVAESDWLDRWLFFAALNAPIVKKQIRSKQFTQDIIDTLGARILELRIPIPRDRARREAISARTREVLEGRAALREAGKRIAADVGGLGAEMLDEEDRLAL